MNLTTEQRRQMRKDLAEVQQMLSMLKATGQVPPLAVPAVNALERVLLTLAIAASVFLPDGVNHG